MAMAIDALRERLYRVKPWVGIAIVVALGLAVFYGVEGTRYWMASRQLEPLESKILQIDQSIQDILPSSEAIELDLEERQLLFEEWTGVFTYDGYPDTDKLLATVSGTAVEAVVNLTSIVIGDQASMNIDGLTYETLSLSLALTSKTHGDVFLFLSMLHQKLPIFDVSGIDLAGFGGEPSADMTLLFYLSPEPEEKETK